MLPDGHVTGHEILTVPIKNNNNLQYYSEIEIGNGDPQPFNVIMDTGSDKLWVPSTHCSSHVCKSHHRFDEARSDTFRPLDHQIHLSYGTGSVHAKLGTDHVKLGDKVISPSYPVALSVKETAKPFSALDKIDGIFGLGKQTQFSTSKPLFSFYLSNDTSKNGTLTVGGLDAKHIDENSPMITHPVSDPNSWTIDLVDIKVGDHRSGLCPDGPCKALIDTGSSLITGPARDIDKLFRAGVHETCETYGHGPSPTVSLIFKNADGNEVEYPLTSKEYSIDFQDDHKECKVGFGPLDIGHRKWVIGDSFLRRYVSVFDGKNHQISFIRSKHDDEGVGVVTREVIPPDFLYSMECVFRRSRARDVGNSFLFSN